MSREKRLTWRTAFGNKRTKAKVRRFYEQVCGCSYCCPDDHRAQIRDRIVRREMADRAIPHE